MAQEFDIHVSTVAFSAYNWLSGRTAPASTGEILAGLRTAWDPRCTWDALAEALTELVSRRRLVESSGFYALRDPARRVATSRDRSGDPWAWMVSSRPIVQSANLDDVLGKVSP